MFALDGADYKSGDIYVVIRDRVCPIFSPPMMNHVICFMPVADVDIKSGDTIHIFGTLSSKSHTLVSWARVMNRRVGELLLQLSNNINRIIY
jgi:alanine racemase